MSANNLRDASHNLHEQLARPQAPRGNSIMTPFDPETATVDDFLALWCDLFPTAPADAVAAWLHGDKGSMRYYPRRDELATVTELRPA